MRSFVFRLKDLPNMLRVSVAMKRPLTQGTADFGISIVRTVVAEHNCMFQKIEQENDLGNDGYIEFVVSEEATGCCVFVQVKTGKSYLSESKGEFRVRSDRRHFQYWAAHSLPVCLICIDPESKRAAWKDITAFIEQAPGLELKSTFDIRVPVDNEFSSETFPQFREHFLRYQDTYKLTSKFGVALDRFAQISDLEACYEGLAALFSFHRNRFSTWYYIVSTFRLFRGHSLLVPILTRLAHLPGHPDILWSDANFISSSIRQQATQLMGEQFGKEEVVAMLSEIGEDDWGRGSLAQCVDSIVRLVRNNKEILEQIILDPNIDMNTASNSLLLLCSYLGNEPLRAIDAIRRFQERFKEAGDRVPTAVMIQQIQTYGGISLY